MKSDKLYLQILLFLFSFFTVTDCLADDNNELISEMKGATGIRKMVLLNKLALTNLYTNPDNSAKFADELLRLATASQNDSMVSKAYYALGLSYYYKEYWTLSAENFNAAINSKWGSQNNLFKARCCNNAGICYEYKGEYDTAASLYFTSIKASEKLGDTLLTAQTQLNLGMLYIRMKLYNKATGLFNKSLPVFIKYNDKMNIINTYQNLFIAEGEEGNDIESEQHFQKAVSLASAVNDSLKLSEIYADYGSLLNSKAEYNKAKHYFQKALNYVDKSVKRPYYYFIIYSMGRNEMYLGNFDSAKTMLTKAHEKFTEMDAKVWLSNAGFSLSRLYAQQGNFILSDSFQQAAIKNEVELYKEKKIKNISEMEVKYDTEKKEQELIIRNLQIASQHKQLLFIGIIAVLFAFALIYVLFTIKKIRNTNRNLFERNKELTSRWEKLKNCSIENKKSENDIYNRIAELMSKEMLFRNPELTVDYVSKKINSNTKYVSGAIKEKTGMNFNTYVNTHRIEEAKKLLLDEESKSWSLDAVAINCGFNNPTTFYLSFKKYTGLTPASFRNIS